MPNNDADPRDDWRHLKFGETQNGGMPIDPAKLERLEHYLENMYPELYRQLNPHVDQIADLLRSQQLNTNLIHALLDDIVDQIRASTILQGLPDAIPAQAPIGRRHRPYPMPYPYYPPFGYPIYGYSFSPEDLLRIMLLQRLGLFPSY